MSQTSNLSQEELKSQIHYCPDTGVFSRIARPRGSNAPMGPITTSVIKQGYLRIRVLSKKYMAHRLAFLYMTGDIPDQVDHIDHNRSNNKWDNLTAATNASNSKNRTLRDTNNTGITGIIWSTSRNRYVVRITHMYKQYWLGQFKTLEEAIAARKAGDIKYGFHLNHGAKGCTYKV